MPVVSYTRSAENWLRARGRNRRPKKLEEFFSFHFLFFLLFFREARCLVLGRPKVRVFLPRPCVHAVSAGHITGSRRG